MNAVATIIARNYLSFARVLARSLAEHHPGMPLHVLLADEVQQAFDPAREPFRLIELRALGVRDAEDETLEELASRLKPHLLAYLLDRGFRRALYLDADCRILGDLTPVLTPAGDPPILLTPHLLDPPSGRDRIERELQILQSGTFNGGCVGVSAAPEGRRFLRWWRERLARHCRRAIGEGVFFDQRWLDHVPVFFEGVEIVRDRGCNVAYWNLPERGLDDVRFFHFSGFDPEEPERMTKYLPLRVPRDAKPLFARYARELLDAGYRETCSLPYAFSTS